MARINPSQTPYQTPNGSVIAAGNGFMGYFDTGGRWHGYGSNHISDDIKNQSAEMLGLNRDPYGSMMAEQMAMQERMMAEQSAAMARQMAMQQEYNAQQMALQQQALLQQEEAAKAANVESGKTAADFTVANADDVARKQMLRRGLMSTYTRYNGQNAQAGGAKAAKLGG